MGVYNFEILRRKKKHDQSSLFLPYIIFLVVLSSLIDQYYLGLKKLTSIPVSTITYILAAINMPLRPIPNVPKNQLRHHITLYFFGFFTLSHIKHGYANVTGNATPPIKPAKLAKNGVATPMKKDKNPEKIRILERSHHGHGLFIFLVYFDSMSSKIGMP
jgi:hypothetical protein